MQTKVKAWEVKEGGLIPLEDQAISFTELNLEQWLFASGDVFGEELLVLSKEMKMPDGGRIDLLCMDPGGRLVIIELKRELGTREALAQALDYASWVDASSTEEIRARCEAVIGDLGSAYEQKFGAELPKEWSCERPKLVLVALGVDEAAARMIDFLSKKYKVDVSAVMFHQARTADGRQLLFRSVLAAVPEPDLPQAAKSKEQELLAAADKRNTRELVDICRAISDTWWEECTGTAGGSFRYWAKHPAGGSRMVFGINASGGLGHPEPGELKVWIRTDKLAQVTGIAEGSIQQGLSGITSEAPARAGMMNFVIGLKTTGEAQALVSQLKEFAQSHST